MKPFDGTSQPISVFADPLVLQRLTAGWIPGGVPR
jgi:hypothetical protein